MRTLIKLESGQRMTRPARIQPDERRVRYHPPESGALSDAQSELYADIVHGPRAAEAEYIPVVDQNGRLIGPFSLMMINPEVGAAVQMLGAALRFSGSLTPRVRELAILTVAAQHRCGFEWMAHEARAAAAGLSTDQIAAIKTAKVPARLSRAESVAHLTALALLRRHRLTDPEYRTAIEALDEASVAELVWLCGYYSMLAVALATFEPAVPPAASTVF